MWTERLKSLLQPDSEPAGPNAQSAESWAPTALPEMPPSPEQFEPRHSNGLEQFFSYIKGESGLSILDLGGASQANVSFITNLGHRLYAEDFLRGLASADADADGTPRPESFLSQNLAHEEGAFDGVLAWDVLEYLPPPLLAATVDRLHRIVKPRSYLFAMFQAHDKAESIPSYCFRIRDSKTLLVAERGRRRPLQVFNNRSLEKLFHDFGSLKFFLARDKLREVIVKR